LYLIRHGQTLFNLIYGSTRKDPGIRDPDLTEEGRRQIAVVEGRRQIAVVAEDLQSLGIRRILASPYTRTLHSAHIIAEALGLAIVVEAQVRERAFFACDIGTARSELGKRWPKVEFGDLPEVWWPQLDESDEELGARCHGFRSRHQEPRSRDGLLVVSHWGFIRGLTGQEVGNGQLVFYNPGNCRAHLPLENGVGAACRPA
jgi:broad specificity phosphatase PhoE